MTIESSKSVKSRR